MSDQAESYEDDAIEVDTEETLEVQPEVTAEEIDDSVENDLEEELEEIEFNGKKYAVDKDMKDAFMRQDDYTRKTQEVAEQRRALEQAQMAFQQHAQIQQQNLQAYSHLAAMDSQLEQYQNVDWQALSNEDPVQAQQAFFQYNQLKDARNQAAEGIRQREQYALHQQQENLARLSEQGKETLQREIPNWSSELAGKLSKSGIEHYGFTDAEMSSVLDPRMVKVLHDAFQYRQMMTKAKAKPTAPDVKPVKSLKGKGPSRKDPSKMNTAEWMEWRNSQVRA